MSIPIPIRLLIVLLTLVAASISGWLAFDAASALATCGDGSGCSDVLLSRWSRWFNVPVSLPAALLYGTLCLTAVATFVDSTAMRWAHTILLAGTTTAALAAIWFVGLQVFSVEAYCKYCLVVHGCGVTAWLATVLGLAAGRHASRSKQAPRTASIPGMAVGIVPRREQATTAPSLAGVAAMTIVAVAVLITGQLISAPPQTYEVRKVEFVDDDVNDAETSRPRDESTPLVDESAAPGATLATAIAAETSAERITESAAADPAAAANDPGTPRSRQVELLEGKITFGVDEVPLLGDPDAPLIVLELFDYTCPRCRKMASTIKQIQADFDNRVAFAVLPVPLNHDCNAAVPANTTAHLYACALARYAMAVYRIDPTKFAAYHDKLMDGDEEPTTSDARQWAIDLVGRSSFSRAVVSSDTTKVVQRGVEIYTRMKDQGIPQILLPNGNAIVGNAAGAEQLHAEFEKLLAE